MRNLSEEIEALHRQGKRVDAQFLLNAIPREDAMGESEALSISRSLKSLYASEVLDMTHEISGQLHSVMEHKCSSIMSPIERQLREANWERWESVPMSAISPTASGTSLGFLRSLYQLSAALQILAWAVEQPSDIELRICY
jgi:hypothetical protein